MSNSDSTKCWEHGPGVPVGLASSARNTHRVAHKNVTSWKDERGKENYDTFKQISFHGSDRYIVTIQEFLKTTIKLL